ncbi:CehA/McbA family metallohydrolase [Planomonospora sp. ID67723]|uniref:CehA/McbA family metallohydrolase n=1 Tax=Planomonospora sp. ID67723 TaxID=2738134 RepID=UPI0018C3B75B|nr:CehA/McbA family metallohydrolase [Planomonospora sp. ID67723]MBG0833050.1 CehA/McbA family metallohydrolase [Planomonospora sp. ID67723]
MRALRRTGHWALADRVAGPVRGVPFELPADARAFTVRLAYDRTAGVLDLGCLGPQGFRGWSGGARSEYTITPAWATPGYLSGEPEPGVWHVLLGLHRVPPGGLPYRLRIIPHLSPPAVPPPLRRGLRPPPPLREPAAARRGLPALGGLRWLAGDLHTHTVHSDGSLTVAELACLAADRGLDFLAVTDHNTVSHHAELPAAAAYAAITLLPGQEITTDLGHANAFGDLGWIDFREPPGAWASTVRERGGVMSINHPVAADCAWRHRMAERPPVVEAWHWSWLDRTWGAPAAWTQAWTESPVMIGGSDYHRPEEGHPPGEPTTWVLCGDSPGGLLDGLRAGATAVSATPDGPLLLRHGDDFLVLDADGLVLRGPVTQRVIIGDRAVLPARPGPHRLETFRNEVMALCS